MSCKSAYFNGWGECASMLEDMVGGILQEKGGTAWTATTMESAATWRNVLSLIADASRDALALPVDSFVNTTDEAEIITSARGKKSIGKKPIPSGTIYLDASICDYQRMLDLEDQWFDFFPFFEGGSHWATKLTDGTFRGFRCKIGMVAGLPPEDKTQSFPVHIFFNSYDEFTRIFTFTNHDWLYDDLLDYVPVGMNLVENTAYASGDLVVDLTVRGSGDGKTGLGETTDWVIRKSNGTPVVATTVVVDNGQGNYTLTIKADSAGTPANLSSGEYLYLQAHQDDATYITYLSEAVKFQVP
jgi:hypothetical protein